ncbi:MAG: ATP-dependent DNA helicase, partial [Candidatus Adiutrix sp.]|jgi:ATP-dependent DNA helicase DinG|nr:ATP-dependent DNA helicase [Candidatus Adiutrix sp.]
MKEALQKLLGPDGPLARAWPDFEPRAGQLAMALEVGRAFQEDDFALVEAGTGTGKTLAYLLPALLSGKKTVVSTGLKNLQDQIFEKDLPFIREFFGDNFRAARLKGRANYLCLFFLKKTLARISFLPPAEADELRLVAARAPGAAGGDRAEFTFIPETSGLWPEISAPAERCLGQRCPEFGDCFLWRARRTAAAADLVLVNHHLFMADLAVRAGGFGEVLPDWEAAVFDEAHLLEEAATGYFGRSLNSGTLAALHRDLERALAGLDPSAGAALKPLVDIFGRRAEDLSLHFCREAREKELWAEGDPENGPLRDFLLNYHHEALALTEGLKASARDSEPPGALRQRLAEAAADLLFLGEAADRQFVYQAERQGRRLTLSALPVRVSRQLADGLLNTGRTLVFTSATLSAGGDFSYFKDRLGLWPELTGLAVESPFDYRGRTLAYIPAHLPAPDEAGFPEAVAAEVEKILALSRGRALVLFTSHRNMDYVAGRLRGRLPWPLLVQGQMGRSAILAEFARRTASVLLATHSFWQGVDVPGESLSAVIIEKLPFPRPDRPLVKARAQLLTEEGRRPFWDYFIPEAALTLKQGLGRLMRRRRDQGLLAVLDTRLRKKNYGKKLLQALPPAPLTSDLGEVAEFFKNI